MIAQPIFSGTEASVEDNSELGEKSCFANSKGERKRGKEMAKKKAGQRKKGKRWQHPSEKKRRKNAWRKILKKAPKMHAFFLAVPESFGGPVFRSRHFFGAACDFVFRLLVPEQMFSKGRNLFKGVIFTEQKLRLPSAQVFRRKKKIPALSAPGLFHNTM